MNSAPHIEMKVDETAVLRDEIARLESALKGETHARHDAEACSITILANLPIIVFAVDKNGVFTFSDGQALGALGMKASQVIGLSAFDLYREHPEITDNLRHVLAFGSHGQWQSEVGGRVFETQCRPLFDERNRVCGATGVSLDLTERLQAENDLRGSEQRFRAASDGSQDAFFILESVRDHNLKVIDFRFVEVNERAAQMVSRRREEIVGQLFCELFPFNRSNGFFDKHVRVVETRVPNEEEFSVSAPDVKAAWVRHQVVPLGDGVAITARDISARKEAEEQLKFYNRQLESSNRDLEHFAYVASHDLQEPLRKIQAFGDRLEKQAGADLPTPARDSIQRMKNAAGRMQLLINDLLTYSRLTTKTRPFAPLDLNEIARRLAIELQREHNIEIEIGALPQIGGDSEQIRQLLQNLLLNAIKFRRAEVVPRVVLRGELVNAAELSSLSSTRLDEIGVENGAQKWCRLEVEDNGIGFDEKYLDRIFAPFQRLHARDVYAGTGIGLAICRKIVERHGGALSARSTPGQGSVFIVVLPQRQPGERTL